MKKRLWCKRTYIDCDKRGFQAMFLFVLKPLFVVIAVADSKASAEDIFDVKFCRSKLVEHYKRTATVPTSVWTKASLVDIHQIYTRLSLVKEKQTPAGSSRYNLRHYMDVFTANINGVYSCKDRRVLGRPLS